MTTEYRPDPYVALAYGLILLVFAIGIAYIDAPWIKVIMLLLFAMWTHNFSYFQAKQYVDWKVAQIEKDEA